MGDIMPPMTDGSRKSPCQIRVKLIAVQEETLKLFAQTLQQNNKFVNLTPA